MANLLKITSNTLQRNTLKVTINQSDSLNIARKKPAEISAGFIILIVGVIGYKFTLAHLSDDVTFSSTLRHESV